MQDGIQRDGGADVPSCRVDELSQYLLLHHCPFLARGQVNRERCVVANRRLDVESMQRGESVEEREDVSCTM